MRKRYFNEMTLKANAFQKTPVEDLSEEIWFQVIQFCFGNRFGSISIDCLFRNLSIVSKSLLDLCIQYVQRIPQDLGICTSQLDLVPWACRNHVKVGNFTAVEHDCSTLWLDLTLHLFKTCNILELHTLDILRISNIYPVSSYEDHCHKRISGISYSATDKKIEDFQYLHSSLANIFSEARPPIKKLCITVKSERWPHPLLQIVSETIEELHLSVYSRERNNAGQEIKPFLDYLRNTIAKMEKLKKLRLGVYFPVELEINSQSLEEIDTRGCPIYVQVAKCTCPSLRMFTCMNYKSMSNLRPVQPFKMGELKFAHKNVRMEKGVFADCAHMLCKDKEFAGMSAPDSCIVRFVNYENY